MSVALTVCLGAFFGIFSLVALYEILAQRQPLTTSKARCWLRNLAILTFNPLSVHLVFSILPAVYPQERGVSRKTVTGATDEQLMQAAGAGDLRAFDELVLRYQGLAWRTAYRFLGDVMEAEDIAQEAFLKILQAAPRYRPSAAFRTYFYRILTHLCIDRTRKRHLSSTDDLPEVSDPTPGPTDILIAQEQRAQVRAALAALAPKQRAAMILRHYEGLSYAEIAQVLGVTPKAVEGLISRARNTLQARLSYLKTN